MTVEELFDGAAAALAAEADLERGRMFGSDALKVGGKVFALCSRGAVVVKVPAARVEELVSTGEGEPFDPGHGRVMREWVAVRPVDAAACEAVLREAHAFVAGRTRPDA